MRELALEERTIDAALALGPRLLERAERSQEAFVAASIVSGPVVVLGAGQRMASVVDPEALLDVRVVRRATSGTAAFIRGRGIVWTLALPHVAWLAPDAEPRSLLNRNVRPFLRGLTSPGRAARYFGREWISIQHRPAALLGYEVSEAGVVLIEVIGGYDDPISIPDVLLAPDEREIDRWLGKSPVSLSDVQPASSPFDIARRVLRELSATRTLTDPPEKSAPRVDVTRADDPIPEGFVRGPRRRVPIGWIETAYDAATKKLWLGGDVLVASSTRSRAAEAVVNGEKPAFVCAIDGCKLDDLAAAGALAIKLAQS